MQVTSPGSTLSVSCRVVIVEESQDNVYPQLFHVSKLNNTAFFSFCQGYERLLGNPQRPITLGLQAAGWKGLQHAPHRVKGKKHQALMVQLCASWTSVLRGNRYIYIYANLCSLLYTAAATVTVTAH